MDLYEALKAGTSADELVKAFYADLNDAVEKLNAEKAAAEAKKAEEDQAREKKLADSRDQLAKAMNEYFHNYFAEDSFDFSFDEIKTLLTGVEKELDSLTEIFNQLTANDTAADVKKSKSKAADQQDDDIITKFLKNL